ncbi:MAG: YARHG domain-containing protein [Hyphomicrobium sp.]
MPATSTRATLKISILAALSAVGLATAIGGATVASAGDIQGDAYSCGELWVMRNQVYKDHGYCFKTSRAISYFGNGGCYVGSEGAVAMSRSERRLISTIRASERRQGC